MKLPNGHQADLGNKTGEPITLYKGQVGTIVMEYDGEVFEVEFSNNDGTTYANTVRLVVQPNSIAETPKSTVSRFRVRFVDRNPLWLNKHSPLLGPLDAYLHQMPGW